MRRIDLELYADRLSRHAERLCDDAEGARMRIAWVGLERRARELMVAHDAALLEALGVFTGADERAERRLLERRVRQLGALERLQAVVEAEISGASDTISPPSSS